MIVVIANSDIYHIAPYFIIDLSLYFATIDSKNIKNIGVNHELPLLVNSSKLKTDAS